MTLKRAELRIELATDGAGVPPSEFRIFKAGSNATTKGVFLFTEKSAEVCMAAAKDYGNEFCVDYDHSMLTFGMGDPAEQKKAAGWFKPSVVAGELWASDVKWTPRAAKMLADKEYRYISPAFQHDESGEIQDLLNVALTNMPATKGLKPLVASKTTQPNGVDPMLEKLIAVLSLKSEATESDVVAKIQGALKVSADVASLAGTDNASEALGKLTAWKDAAAKVEALSQELVDMKRAALSVEVEAMLDKAVAEFKVTPAQRELLSKQGMADPTFLKAYLSMAPAIVKAQEEKSKEPGIVIGELTDMDKKTASLLGIRKVDVAKLAAIKAEGVQTVANRKDR